MNTSMKLEIQNIYPLTPMQEGMLYNFIASENSHAYFEQISFDIENVIDINLLESSLNIIISRHEILRAIFNYKKADRPIQIILKERKSKIHFEDISYLEMEKQQEFIENFKSTEKDEGFNLTKDLLIKVATFKKMENKYTIVFSFHHILMDGWCIGIIVKELFSIYESQLDGKEVVLGKTYPYGDYIKWLEKQDKRKAKEYWSDYLRDYDEQVSLPKVYTNSIDGAYKYADRFLNIDKDMVCALEQIARNNNVTLNTIFQGIWALILSSYNNSNDIVFGAVVSGRPYELQDADKMVGLFINTVPVRVKFDDHAKFVEIIKEIQKKSLESQKYDYFPLAEIQSSTLLKQELIDHIMIFENYPLETEMSNSDSRFKITNVETFEQTNYNFNIVIMPGEELTIKLSYNELVYDNEMVKRIEDHIKEAIVSITSNSNIEINDINILTLREKEQLLSQFNDTKAEYPKNKTIHQLFEEQVERDPNNIAVVCEDKKLTYRELDERSNQLARQLRAIGIKRDELVGIMLKRSVNVIISMIAILKSGGAYLPIDNEYPDERIDYILQDSDANIIITDNYVLKEQDKKFTLNNIELINLDDNEYLNNANTRLENINIPSDLAYVIYTSGSTGQPKGTMIEHRNVVNFIYGILNKIDMNKDKSILSLTTISFDIFVLETILPLTKGLMVVMASDDEQKDPKTISELLLKNNIEIIQSTPSRIKMIIENCKLNSIKSLKKILIGGDDLPKNLKDQISLVFKGKVFNMYGPTETTVWSTVKDVTADNSLNIGKPISNTSIYILNKYSKLQPIGVFGELCIGGDGVSRGYFRKKELTNEKFCINPFKDSERIYRTGDLARWLLDGDIEFLGRVDQQVKVRGYRIEVGEIEAKLQQYPNIKEVVVMDGKDINGDKYLIAYYVSEKAIYSKALHEFLMEFLPKYMIPSYFVQIEKIPLTPNGKVNRCMLMGKNPNLEEAIEYVEPSNEFEKKISKIWCDVLGRSSISVNSDFFLLGGHSINMIQIIAKISNVLNFDISIKEFNNNSTIEKLSKYIYYSKEQNRKIIYPKKKPELENRFKQFPLTDVQLAYLMGRDEKYELGGVSTHMYMEIETPINIDRLNIVINKLIKRHDMLHSIILPTGQQKILEKVPEYKIKIDNLIGVDKEIQQKHIEKERNRMSHYIFKSDEWPLFEIKALQISGKTNYIFVGIDMLIADAGSMMILTKEINELYNNLEVKIPELKFSFRDYIIALNEFKESEKYNDDKKYWLSKVESFPPAANLPLKVEPIMVKKPHFKRIEKTIYREEWDKLKELCSKNKITPSALLCTAYSEILGFWSNQNRLGLNLTVFNRYPFNEEVENIIGDFTSVILVDVDLNKGETLVQKAKSVHETLIEALDHRNYDGIAFLRELSRYNNLGNKALMPIVFTSMLLNNKFDSNDLSKVIKAINQTSQVYLDHQVMEQNGDLVIIWDYVQELFYEDTIQFMFNEYCRILNNVIENYNLKLSIPEYDSDVIRRYNDTKKDIGKQTLVDLFLEQVKIKPDNIAVEYKNDCISYKELDEKSNKVANYLISKGIENNENVAVIVNREVNTIVSILGILKSGAAYVPIDPQYPDERKNFIIKNSSCKIVLTNDFCDNNELNDYSEETRINNSKLSDNAYIIYTSGSTGKPKGVIIKQEAVSNTIIDINDRFDVNDNDRIIGLSSMCFDLSVYDIFGALSSGATLVIAEDQRDAFSLVEILNKNKITIWNSVPAIMELLVDNIDSEIYSENLRLVLLSGDWIPLHLPGKIKRYFTKAEIISLGGATEASIWSIYYPIKEVRKEWNSIPYGMPLQNQNMYILNYDLELCPINVSGEIYIGGVGVALGYMNDKERTQNSFIEHPYLGLIYKTGDFGVLRNIKGCEETYIEFQGRKDHQVKIRGYRIEIGEIEKCLLGHEFISNVKVIDRNDTSGKKNLYAYYVLDKSWDDEDDFLSADELKIFLSRQLPEYMIPAYFIELDDIPLSSNGKVDRNKLPIPNIVSDRVYLAPTNQLERKLCSIIEEVLNVEKVGISDNCFDIGGNSLNAATIISRVRREFNINIPLKELFQTPNVIGIANYIEENRKNISKTSDNNLILLRKGTDKTKNLFLIHAGSGEIEGYIDFCNNLREDYNYWAIKADRLVNYAPKYLTIEEIAKDYSKKIKEIQEVGPYCIAGWCLGGTIAYEITKYFEESGEKIDFFSLINSYAPDKDFYGEITDLSLETEKEYIGGFLSDNDVFNIIQLEDFKETGEIWMAVIEAVYKYNLEDVILKIKGTIPQNIANIIPHFNEINIEGLIYYLNVIRSYSYARARYIPKGAITSKIIFFEASETNIENKYIWKKYCNNEIIYELVNGTHFSIFSQPNVLELASKFGDYFNQIN